MGGLFNYDRDMMEPPESTQASMYILGVANIAMYVTKFKNEREHT